VVRTPFCVDRRGVPAAHRLRRSTGHRVACVAVEQFQAQRLREHDATEHSNTATASSIVSAARRSSNTSFRRWPARRRRCSATQGCLWAWFSLLRQSKRFDALRLHPTWRNGTEHAVERQALMSRRL
jgi:hypothetical protein